jgi:lipoprotein-anchoring transpeptidase ErfK/SrfK
MRTIERNYRKNPHTASFLQVFHTGIGSTGRNYREEMAQADDAEALALEAAQDDDLLNLVPEVETIDNRTPGQVKFMDDLIARLAKLDSETGAQAREFTDRITAKGGWTSGRGGNASQWIDRMLSRERELSARTKAPAAPKTVEIPAAPKTVEIPAGTYAVTTDEVRCYTIDYGKEGTRWAGFLFLNRISSDDRFPIKNPVAKAEILAAISADVEAAEILAHLTLRKCRRCGRQLSDTKNPYFSVALGPECGAK